jgi:hypothetical protein
MKTTVSRLFDSHDQAAAAVQDLETAGYNHHDISLVSPGVGRQAEGRSFAPGEHHDDNIHAAHGVAQGALIGAGIGGGATLLAGASLLAVPGMGPVLAAGFLTAALAGAGAGGATGAMMGAVRDAGHSEADAHALTEGLRRGGSVFIVRAPEDRAELAEEILVRHGGVEATAREQAYAAESPEEFIEPPPKPHAGV